MALTFPRVEEVAVGDPVSSRNLAQLADAINTRITSGLGDGAYRIVQFWLNAFRQIRNQDALGQFPSQAEFFTTYQQLGPEWTWPDAGPGDNEGVNVSTLVGSYVFGNSTGNVYDEKTRLIIDGVPVSVAGSPSAAWALAKEQRGAYDPVTRGVACPAFTAAMSYSALTQGQYTPHGKAYGGFYPIPDSVGTCTDGTESLELKWTRLDGGGAATFSGTCSDVSTDVGAVYAMPLGWYVVKNNGETTYLPRNEYIEGPYTRGEHPRHTWGNHLPRAFAQFSSEFRGTNAQREDEVSGLKPWLGNAFSIAGFLSRPYYLAPAFGTEISSGTVVPVYPRQTLVATNVTYPPNTIVFINESPVDTCTYNVQATTFSGPTLVNANLPPGETAYFTDSIAFDRGCSFGRSGAGVFFVWSAVSHAATRYFYYRGTAPSSSMTEGTAPPSKLAYPDGTRIGSAIRTEDGFGIAAVYVESVNLYETATVEFLNGDTVFATATVSASNPSAIVTLTDYEEGTKIFARVSSPVRFSGTGSLSVEFAHLQKYKPQFMDMFLALRLSGAKLQDSQATDGSGLSEEAAKDLWTAYTSTGAITLTSDHGELEAATTLGSNAVFDVMRRMSKSVRMIPRNNIVAYAVENGKSVVWVDPRAFATPGAADADLLSGITDAIKTTADPRGYTNEWCGFVNVHSYHVSESSLWKPSAYSDYFPIIDRCGFYAPVSGHVGPNSLEMRRFVTYGAAYGGEDIDLLIAPEYASGYRYAKDNNHSAVGRPSFYKSCRIYEPPLAIESAQSESGGLVKITFTGRFHAHESAPASISSDIGTWDIAALTAEADDYRTEENALREYLVHAQGSGSYQCSRLGEGNSEAGRIVDAIPDNPFGSCYPTLFLVQLIPKPYADGNDRQDASDTPFESFPLRMAESYLRIMCEGYVDQVTSAASGCDVGATFEFTWDKCCYHATGLPWLQMIGDTASKFLPASEIRTDTPEGFGPMPTTMAAAGVFNGFAKVVNSLTRVRITLPWDLEVDDAAPNSRTQTVGGFRRSDGGALDCSTYTGGGLFWQGGQPDVTPGAYAGAWYSAPYATSSLDTVVSYSGGSYTCDGSAFQLFSERRDQRYRVHLTDPDALNACPESWRGLIDTNAEFVAIQTTTRRRTSWVDGGAGTGDLCGASAGWQDGSGGEYTITYADVPEAECGKFQISDTLHAPAQSSINLAASKNGAALCDAGATYSSGIVTRNLQPVDPSAFILAISLSDPTTDS